jgi:hypothetical protein
MPSHTESDADRTDDSIPNMYTTTAYNTIQYQYRGGDTTHGVIDILLSTTSMCKVQHLLSRHAICASVC